MDAPSDRAPDPLASWLAATNGGAAGSPPPPADEPEGASSGPSARRRLLAVAAVPWLVVIPLGAVALQRSAPAASSAPLTPVSIASSPSGEPVAGNAPHRDAVLDDELAAAAVLTVRLSTPADQYLDTAVAERLLTVHGAAVVTVAAAVLDRVDGSWTGPRHVRFAIPLSLDHSEPVALGPPWVLPSTDRSRAEPDADPVDDEGLAGAATAALQAAGYRDLATPRLRRHTALPDILAVRVRASAPGEPVAREHEIWLDAAASRVLGAPAPGEPGQLPAPVPVESP